MCFQITIVSVILTVPNIPYYQLLPLIKLVRGSKSGIIKSGVNPGAPITREKPDSNWIMMMIMMMMMMMMMNSSVPKLARLSTKAELVMQAWDKT